MASKRGILGQKVGMTQIWDEQNRAVPVTVIRGPHKDKDSREHFEMRIHKRLLDILEPSPKTVDSLQRIELPAGVDIEIKIQTA